MTSNSSCCLFIYVTVIIFVAYINAGTLSDKKTLYDFLLTDYNKEIPPVTQQSDYVSVQIALNIVALNEIDEVLEKFALSGYFEISWYDVSMIWNASDFG